MNKKSETGKHGEDLACEYLINKGYKIIEKNHRQKWGEIDIITLDKNGVLTLIEVKTVSGMNPNIRPEDQMSHSKIDKFKRTAYLYANHYFKNRDDSRGWRLDLVAINLNGNDCQIEHYENIS
jgi:putative endonuclease